MILAGRAGGTWTGNGITSSSVATDPGNRPLGYAEASGLLGLTGAATATFRGQTVDATSVLIRYTLSGDADLDGTVNLNDLIRLANHYGTPTNMSWSDGDFDFDGMVNLNDLIRLANNYGGVLPGEAIPGASNSFQNDLAAAFNGTAVPLSVPEPGVLGWAALGAGGMLMRRRRRAC